MTDKLETYWSIFESEWLKHPELEMVHLAYAYDAPRVETLDGSKNISPRLKPKEMKVWLDAATAVLRMKRFGKVEDRT